MPEEDEESEDNDDENDDEIKKLVSNGRIATNINRMAPLSTISEVTLDSESDAWVRILF